MYIQALRKQLFFLFRNYVNPLLENFPSNLDGAEGDLVMSTIKKVQNYSEKSGSSSWWKTF